jgi:uncharacterized Tic20 family protein
MKNMLIDFGLLLLSITIFIGSLTLIYYLIRRKKKLNGTMSKQELKKMYKNALYTSLSFIFIGIIIYIVGIYIGGIGDITYFGWIILAAGLIATIYSCIGLYSVK